MKSNMHVCPQDSTGACVPPCRACVPARLCVCVHVCVPVEARDREERSVGEHGRVGPADGRSAAAEHRVLARGTGERRGEAAVGVVGEEGEQQRCGIDYGEWNLVANDIPVCGRCLWGTGIDVAV